MRNQAIETTCKWCEAFVVIAPFRSDGLTVALDEVREDGQVWVGGNGFAYRGYPPPNARHYKAHECGPIAPPAAEPEPELVAASSEWYRDVADDRDRDTPVEPIQQKKAKKAKK